MSEVKVIFFDVGNTLYKNEEMEEGYPRQLHNLLAMDRKISLPEAKELLKNTEKQLKEKLTHVTKVSTMEALGYTRRQVHDAFCKVNPNDYLSKNPELSAFLVKLSERFRLGLITNFRKSHVKNILDVLGINMSVFEIIVSEDNIREIKPHKEPFLKAVQLAGVAPEECVYVADCLTKDIIPAKSIGMKTIIVSEAEIADSTDVAISDVLELETALRKIK
jgi:HAD superfamily hydrolase (TIGR01549 family)